MQSTQEKRNLKKPNFRLELLQHVGKLISQDRNLEYGEPADNLERTVQLLRAYLGNRTGKDLKTEDVAVIGILLKVGRLAQDTSKIDSWGDIAGYAAIGAEVMRERTGTAGVSESNPSLSVRA